MNWSTVYVLLKNMIGDTKEELEQEIIEKIGLTNQFLDELPEVGESGVLYFIPKDNVDSSAEDQYFMYVWDPDASDYVLLDPDTDLSIYAKSADLANVATSGSYTDLDNKPDLSQYLTKAEGDASYVSYDNYNDKEVTGNPALFYSVSGGRVKKAEVAFSPKQSGTGDPSPSNIRPISGWDELELTQTGANLFDINNVYYTVTGTSFTTPTGGYSKDIYTGTNGETTAVGSAYLSKLPFLKAGTYTLSYSAGSQLRVGLVADDGTVTTLTSVISGQQFTLTTDSKITLRRVTNAERTYTDLQIQAGSIKTDYEAYITPITHITTFPIIVYGGKVVWKDRVVKAIIDKVFMSFSNAQLYGNYGIDNKPLYYVDIPSEIIIKQRSGVENKGTLMSNYFTQIEQSIVTQMPNNKIRTNANNIPDRLYFRWDSATDLSAINMAFSIIPLQIIAELQTQIEIALTSETIELLKGNNTLWTDGDNVDLIAVPVAKELPAVTSSDEGKVLTVDANGNWVAAESEAVTALQQQY